MFFDYNSLLVATGIAAFAAGSTFLVSWASDRSGGFLATCAYAMLTIAGAIGAFIVYSTSASTVLGFIACALLLIGLTLALAGGRQFRGGTFQVAATTALALTLVIATALPYLNGYNGLSFAFVNLAAGALLAATAREYWLCRQESPAAISGIALLYIALSLSFVLCGIMLISETPLVMSGPPDNWAESVNLTISVFGVTGIGALSVALNHHRLVRRHRDASRTDLLTGMWNRRALFEQFYNEGLPLETSVVMFDLDHFKAINDAYGHATGDRFLAIFADICRNKLRPSDIAVRLGGEEFVTILPDANPVLALAIAESIRIAFAKQTIPFEGQAVSCTVSAGLCTNTSTDHQQLDTMLRHADGALYCAKHGGRNLVCTEELSAAA